MPYDVAALFVASPTPTIAIDGDGVVREVNPAAEALFNLGRTALVGRQARTLIDPLSLGGEGPYVAYDQVVTVHGRRMTADLVAAPMTAKAGWKILTLHGRAPAQLAAMRDGGQRSATAVAAMLAHEIKNPLSAIRGAAQLLEQSVDADGAPLTTLIREEVDRIARLIDRMEGFTDSRPLTRSAENIHAILAHARDVAARGFAREVVIRELYDPSLPAVLGNRDALVQVFVNLIKNAAEALAGGGGGILLRTGYRPGLSRRTDDATLIALPIEVCVIDDGPGPPDAIADHLFEPFVSSKRSGGGLGLAMVDKLVSDHGGLVEYAREGDPPRTVFRLLLPRAPGGHA